MTDIALKLAPILFGFVVGVAGQQLGWLKRHHADRMLRLVVWLGLPPLILASIAQIHLTPDLVQLPLFALCTALIVWPSAVYCVRRLQLPREKAGVFVTGVLMMNLAFEYPFILAVFGEQGFAYLALVDFGNAIIILILANFLSAWYGGHSANARQMWLSVLSFPPLLAMFAAVAINLAGLELPQPVLTGLTEFGRWLVLLVLVAMGIYFEMNNAWLRELLLGIGIRVGLGLACGLVWVELFDLEGMMRSVVLLAAAAPIGFNTVVYAGRQGLDKPYAAHLVSVSVLLGIIYLPVMVYVL